MPPSDGCDRAIAEVGAASTLHPGVSVHVGRDGDRLYLHAIEAEPAGEGLGTSFMNEMMDVLDRTGVAMELDISDAGGDAGMERLERWYATFGFEPVGGGRMRREAQDGIA